KVITVSGINYIITVTPTSKFNGRAVVANNKGCTLSNVVIPNAINYNGAYYDVVEIGDKAFYENNDLKTVTISSVVEKIDPDAFVGCNNLEQINVERGSRSYRSEDGILYSADKEVLLCVPIGKKLETFSVPTTVRKIENCAFYGNDKLYSIIFPSELKEIGDHAFTNCSVLSKITTANKLEKIGRYAFAQTDLSAIGLFSSLKEIGEGAFMGTNLRSIKIPSSIEVIPEAAFYNCDNLKTVVMGDNVKDIGNYAFCDTAVEEIKLADKTTTIGYACFANCPKLKDIKLANVKVIGNAAFANCNEIEYFTVTKNIQQIGGEVFIGCDGLKNINVESGNQTFADIDGVLYDKGMTELIKYPASKYTTNYKLPGNIRNIVEGALDGCKFISEYTVEGGNSYFSDEDGVLYDHDKSTLVSYPKAKSTSNFNIPESVTKIEKGAFEDSIVEGCINIPSNVAEIGDNAFAGCKKVAQYAVNKYNRNFKSVDGVLLSIDGARLLQYPIAAKDKSYTIPAGVTT
ncbi:MAG: leucine-rich repeat domain-containing protein, partial [Firmicutes bacterium]|nr:leucine-rich repeat domain-containing protein [Bacillota bacterium]